MDSVKLQIELELSELVSAASVDSLIMQMTEVVAAAVEERQLEIPDAEIQDYEITYEEF